MDGWKVKGPHGWIGFGGEAPAGRPVTATKFFRFVPMGSEVCDACDAIRPFAELDFVGCADDEDGTPIYHCKNGHERTTDPNAE